MPIANLTQAEVSSKLKELRQLTDEMVVVFPGGFELGAQQGLEAGDGAAIVASMLGQLNSALVPLGPFFTMLDAFKAIFDFAKATVEGITELDPTKPLQKLGAVLDAANKLASLFPPAPIFPLVFGMLTVIVEGLRGLIVKLQAMAERAQKIALAEQRALETGNPLLAVAAVNARGNFNAQLSNLDQQFKPLNRIIGIVNILLELAGLDCIPTIGGGPVPTPEGIAALQAVVDLLDAVKSAIPGGSPALSTTPEPGTC